MNKAVTEEKLNNTLWGAANSLRGNVDAGVFKDYILVLLFYKYISDLHQKNIDKLKERYGDDEERILLRLKNERFIIPNGASFHDVFKQQHEHNLGEIINKALHKIEDANGDRLKGLFDNVNFNSDSILGKAMQRNKMLVDLLGDFNKINLQNIDDDIIGNAYMYLIEKFGADAGKSAGEFFTPKQVAKLLAKLGGAKPGFRICDPACGSAGLLLLAGEEVEAQDSKDYALYGQEKIGSTYNLARMNMFLHGKDASQIEWGDTLNNPLLLENDKLMKFDLVVANPPFSLDKWGAENAESDKFNRFHRGLPPKSKGDYAFISHMIEVAKKKEGRVAVIVPHGVLFRGSSEGKIRQKLIEENLLDTVIGLPANLFQTTGIPVAILVFDRTREKGGINQSRKEVLFIDASKEFKAGKRQNILEDSNIERILNTVKNRQAEDKFSHLATFEEIKENDFNLNIPRYVDTFEEEEEIDLAQVQKELEAIDAKIKTAEANLNKQLKQFVELK